MLDKSKVKELFHEKKFIDVANIFRDEYTNLVFGFAKKNDIYIDKYTTIEDLLIEIPNKYPHLSGCINLVSMILYSEDITVFENIDDMLTYYKNIVKKLT